MPFPMVTDLNATWQYITEGIRTIMEKDLESKLLTREQHMLLYTAIHNLCVSSQSSEQTRVRGFSKSTQPAYSLSSGGDLYNHLVSFFKDHLEKLLSSAQKLHGDALVAYYNECWVRFMIGVKPLDHLFAYLNRHWVPHQRDGGSNVKVYEISCMCLMTWRTSFFEPLKPALISALLDLIERHRDGHHVSLNDLKLTVQSLISIGLDEQNTKRSSLLLYTDEFEKPFLTSTERYYKREGQLFFQENSVVAYMYQVDKRLKQEHLLVNMFLQQTTETQLIATVQNALIETNAQTLQNEFLPLLSSNDVEKCHLLYKLLDKISGGLIPVQTILKEYVQKQGLDAVDALDQNADPKLYIATLHKTYLRFKQLVSEAFQSSPGMTRAVELGCEEFINNNNFAKRIVNPVTGQRAAQSKTPELLAKFCDSLFKKSSKITDQAELEQSMDCVVDVLQFITERDLFESHYSRLLARRLVHRTSASRDIENDMVNRINTLSGVEYTSKLRRMFQDIDTSEQMQSSLKNQNLPENSPDFAPMVLAMAFWPLPANEVAFKLPENLKSTFNAFTNYYTSVHSGRKLKWLWNFAKGELNVNFGKGKPTYLLLVSIYQLALLLLFNDQNTRTFNEFQTITGLPDDVIAGSLTYIVKAHILKESPENEKLPQSQKSYTINTDFKTKKLRINLNLPLSLDNKTQQVENDYQIQESRKLHLQLVVTRIMKARETMSHAELVQETVQLARKRFLPTVKDVKQTISRLIEKDYLERLPDGQSYRYLA